MSVPQRKSQCTECNEPLNFNGHGYYRGELKGKWICKNQLSPEHKYNKCPNYGILIKKNISNRPKRTNEIRK